LKLYDKTDDFNFHIETFPFICSNIPTAPAYAVYISQVYIPELVISLRTSLIEMVLRRTLLNQWFLLMKLKSSLRKIYGRHHGLFDCYWIYVVQMITNMFHLSQHFPIRSSFLTYQGGL